MKALRVTSYAAALVLGALAAILTYEQALAATEFVRWQSAVSSNWVYCVGTGGSPTGTPWHFTDGIDLFADTSSPCGDTTSDPVWAHTYGKTSGGFYELLGVAYDNTGQPDTNCYNVKIDVYILNGSPTWVGTEWYLHVEWIGGDSIWYDIDMGSGNWDLRSVEIGDTTEDERSGCDWSGAPHAHQELHSKPAGTTLGLNNNLDEDELYDLLDVADYIHEWSW